MAHNPLSSETNGACSNNSQSPWVGSLLSLGPEAVLSCLVLGELVGLERVGLGVLLLLVGLGLSIATDVSKEGIVGGRCEESDGVELARSPEEERERQVDESVTQVAGNNRSVEGQGRANGSCHILGVANDAPDAFAVESSIASILLVLVELVISQNLEGESSTEDKDGEVMGPFERS